MKKETKDRANKHAVIYLHQPLYEAGDAVECGQAESNCRSFAERNKFVTAAVFRDTYDEELGVDHREGLELLFGMVNDGGIDALIIADRKDLPESLQKIGYSYETLSDHGTELIVLDGEDDRV